MTVDEIFRNKGIGSRLLEFAIDWAIISNHGKTYRIIGL